MGIAFFTIDALAAPLRRAAQWLLRASGTPGSRPQRQQPASRSATRSSSPHDSAPASRRPLRVVRVVEGPRAGAGRMFMSGCMADVCAELERLAALEAAAG